MNTQTQRRAEPLVGAGASSTTILPASAKWFVSCRWRALSGCVMAGMAGAEPGSDGKRREDLRLEIGELRFEIEDLRFKRARRKAFET